MPSRRREIDCTPSYNFTLAIDGQHAGYFQAVDGLASTVALIEFEDSDDLHLKKQPLVWEPGSTLTLKRGWIETPNTLKTWLNNVRKRDFVRRNIEIHLEDSVTRNRLRTWKGLSAWPTLWSHAQPDSNGSVLTQNLVFSVGELIICHE